MSGGFLGWLAALVFLPVAGAAFGLGFWKSAILYAAASAVAAPVDWTGGRIRRARLAGPEKILFCLMLTLVATMATGIDIARSREGKTSKSNSRHAPFLSALTRKGGADGEGNGLSAQALEDRNRRRRVRLYRSAVTNARDCDDAHRVAAGAISAGTIGTARDMRTAAANAAMHCEKSWISFNGLDPIERAVEDNKQQEAEQLRACNEGYLGRWQVNDDLLYAMDQGLAARDVKRIDALNRQSEARIAGCAGFLREAARIVDRGKRRTAS